MRVLVTESKPGAADDVRTDLVTSGHQVFLCHSDGGDDFHCAGVIGHGPCPLDLGMVDVLVDVRDVDDAFTTREYGVTCAKRSEVPVVIAGPYLPVSSGRAFDSAAMQCEPDDVVDVVETVVALPDTAALHALRSAVRTVLARRLGDSRAMVSLIDHGFYVDVIVRAPSVPDKATALDVEHAARAAMRPHRDDWVHTRVVFRRMPAGGRTSYDD